MACRWGRAAQCARPAEVYCACARSGRLCNCGAGGSPVACRISCSDSVSRLQQRRAPARRAPRGARAAARLASSWQPLMMRCTSASIERCGLLAERLVAAEAGRGPPRKAFSRGASCTRPTASLMPQRVTMLRAMLRGLLDVVLGAGGLGAVHHLLRRAAAQHADDARAQVGLGVVVAVGLRPLVGHAQRLAARHDAHAVHRVGARHHQAQDGVAALVVGDALAVFGGSAAAGARGRARSSPARPGSPCARTASSLRRAASSAASFTRFFRSAPEKPGVACASSSRCTSGASGTLRVCTRRMASRPALSGRFTTTRRSKRPGAQQRAVQHVGLVGGGQHDDAFAPAEAVHLGQDLLQRLLLLAVAAAEGHAARARARWRRSRR